MSTYSNEQWVKSSYSSNGGDNCLEWAPAVAPTGTVPVRDSKNADGPTLSIPTQQWTTFVCTIKPGHPGSCTDLA